ASARVRGGSRRQRTASVPTVKAARASGPSFISGRAVAGPAPSPVVVEWRAGVRDAGTACLRRDGLENGVSTRLEQGRRDAQACCDVLGGNAVQQHVEDRLVAAPEPGAQRACERRWHSGEVLATAGEPADGDAQLLGERLL